MYDTIPEVPDNEDALTILRYLRDCALRWDPEARLIGNARAVDIVRAVDEIEQILGESK